MAEADRTVGHVSPKLSPMGVHFISDSKTIIFQFKITILPKNLARNVGLILIG